MSWRYGGKKRKRKSACPVEFGGTVEKRKKRKSACLGELEVRWKSVKNKI